MNDFAIVMGRLDETGARFVAHAPNDEATLQDMVRRDQLGRPGTVAQGEKGLNIFTAS